jgi:drug/metabolite transporter (DMT)-like permease
VAHLAFIFICLVWGTSFILLERVTHALGPVEIGIWRLLSGAVALGAICAFQHCKLRFTRREWGQILLIALLANSLPHVVLPYVLMQGFGHSFFGTLVALIPLITIVISVPMLGVRPTRRQLVGVLGGLACIAVMMTDGVERGMSLWLLGLAIIVPLTSAVSNTYIKWKLSHLHAVPMTAAILVSAGLMLMPLEYCRPVLESLQLAGPAVHTSRTLAIAYVLLLGTVGTGLSTAVFVWLILKEGPLYAGMTTYVVPVLALVWGQFDHETITLWQLTAMAGALSMVALVQAQPARARKLRPLATTRLSSPVEPAVVAAEAAAAELARPTAVREAADSSHQAA